MFQIIAKNGMNDRSRRLSTAIVSVRLGFGTMVALSQLITGQEGFSFYPNVWGYSHIPVVSINSINITNICKCLASGQVSI